MKIMLTEEKVAQMVSIYRSAQQKQSLSVRELARMMGKMTATLFAIYHSVVLGIAAFEESNLATVAVL